MSVIPEAPEASKGRYGVLLLLGLLLGMALLVVLGWLPWQQMQQEIERHQRELSHRLQLISENLEQQARVTADTLVADLQRDPVVLRRMVEANSVSPVDVTRSRQQLLAQMQPRFAAMQALQVRQFQFHDANGNSFLRLHQPERFGDSLLSVRPALVRVMREHKPVSVYEAGRASGGYRSLYPLFAQGQYQGSLEIGFSPTVMASRIQTAFTGAYFYFLSAIPEQSFAANRDHSLSYQALAGINDFELDVKASDSEVQWLQPFLGPQSAPVQGQLASLLPGVIPLGQLSLLVQPVQDLAGRYSAAILVVVPDTYRQQLRQSFDKQLLIGMLITCLLVAGLVWTRHQRAQVNSAFTQLSLALQGGEMRPWDYFPQRNHRLLFSTMVPAETRGWQQRKDTDLDSWLSNLHPDDQPLVKADVTRQLRNRGHSLTLEFRIMREGSWRWISANGRAMDYDSRGQVERFSGVYRDITSEKRMQLALEQSEQKYRALFASNKAVELIVDPVDGSIIDANQAAVEYYRYPRRELVGMCIRQINILSPEAIQQEMDEAQREQRSHFHFRHRLANGLVRDVEVYSGPIVMADGHRYLYSIIHDITAREQARQALHESKTRFDSLFSASMDGILMVDSRGQLEYWNRAAADVLEHKAELVRGEPLPWDSLAEADLVWLREQRYQAVRGVVLSPKGRLREFCLTLNNGEQRWLEVAISSFQQAHCWHFVAVIRDITERKQQEMALHQAHIAFENTMEGIIITDTRNQIVSVNRAVEKISGYSREELIGKPPSTFSSGVHGEVFYTTMWKTLSETGHWQGEISNRHKEGRIYTEWLNINAVRNDAGQVCNYVAVFSDISDLKSSRERLDYLAHHDLLTGLPNRLVFRERLEQGIVRARRSGDPVAVLFIDLDRFKHINDNLGHDVGDELLQEVAQILSGLVRDCDTVVRLGGDEFSIIMENFTDLDALASRAGRMIDSLSQPITTGSGHELRIGASVGIAVYPQDAPDATSLVKHADIAMYRAKELGKGRYEFYNQKMTDAARQRFSLEAALDAALDADDQIQVYYQPQVDLKRGGICGLEALVRWQHPELGMVGPDRFIPLAEENGMIHRIGLRVTELALRDLAQLRERGLFKGLLAINISTLELESPEFADQMLALCQRYGLVESIELEVTETGLGRHPEQFFAHLRKLRACGFKVAIDDFGTGHSTLIRLKQCPSDYLKIDQTFIKDLPADLDDLVITRTIVSLGQSLGQQVVAEGIETAEQAALLSHLGCDIGQGFFFSKPLSLPDLQRYLAEHPGPRSERVLDEWLS